MRVGAYTMDVYCDVELCHVQQSGPRSGMDSATGQTRADVKKKLRDAGWRLDKLDNCPSCVAAGNHPTKSMLHHGSQA